MVYLKSGILAQFTRATKQQTSAFFTANSAHSTALSVVRPKLSLAADKSTFTSWNGHSYTTSSGAGSGTSPGLIALSASNDDTLQESKRGRRPFGTFATRRYSASAVVRQGKVDVRNIVEDASPPQYDERAVKFTEEARSSAQELERLLREHGHVAVCQRGFDLIQAGRPLDTTAFNHLFASLEAINADVAAARPGQPVSSAEAAKLLGLSPILRAYEEMQQREVAPDLRTFSLLLSTLLRQHQKSRDRRQWLLPARVGSSTKQAVFAQDAVRRLEKDAEIDVGEHIVDLFVESTQAGVLRYTGPQLDGFLMVCAERGDSDTADVVFDRFAQLGVSRSCSTFAHMMEAKGRAGDTAAIAATFALYKKEFGALAAHDIFSVYQSVVRAYIFAGQSKKALSFWSKVASMHGRSDSDLKCDAITQAFSSLTEVQTALDFSKGIQEQIVRDRALGQTCALAVRLRDRAGAMDAYSLVTSPASANSISARPFDGLIAFLAETGHLDDLMDVVERCMKANIEEVSMGVWSFATSRLMAAGRVIEAMEILQFAVDRTLTDDMAPKKQDLAWYLELFVSDMSDLGAWNKQSLVRFGSSVENVWWALYPGAAAGWLNAVQDHVQNQGLLVDATLLRQMARIGMAVHPIKTPRFARSPQAEADTTILGDAARGLIETATRELLRGSIQLDWRVLSDLSSLAAALDMNEAVQTIEQIRYVPTSPDRSACRLPLPSTRQAFAPLQNISTLDPRTDSAIAALAGREPRAARSSSGHITRVVELARGVFESGALISGETMLRVIAGFARAGAARELTAVQDLFLSTAHKVAPSQGLATSAEALVLDALVIAWHELGDHEQANHLRQRLLDSDFLPSARSFATSIAKLDDKMCHDTASRAVEILQEAVDLGVQPDVYLFNTVIAKLAKARRSDEAFELFEEMKLSGLQPSAVTYGTIINACCRVGKSERAEALLDEMEALSGGAPRIAPYNTLIQHFVQTKRDRGKALFYWERLQRRTITPTSHSYRLLIEAHGHLPPADPMAAENVVRTMQSSGVLVETIHHAQILHMYGAVLNDLPAAQRYFGRILSQGVVVDEVLMQAIIECYVKNGDVGGMESMMAKMSRYGVSPNAYITNLAIEGYQGRGDTAKARALFDALPTNAGSKGKEPSTYEAMIRLYAAQGDLQKGREVLNELRAQRYPPAVVARAAALVA